MKKNQYSPGVESKFTALKTNHADINSCKLYIAEYQKELQKIGYINASIDSIKDKKDTIEISIYYGTKYIWEQLRISNSVKKELLNAGFENLFENLKIKDALDLPEKILLFYENTGYPFASIKYDSVDIRDNKISASLQIKKGIKYSIDSLRVFGNVKIKNLFLQKYLSIENGVTYNKLILQKINQKINELPYLKAYKDWDLLMLSQSSLVNLYLNTVNTNKLDAIIGFLPSNKQTSGNLLLTIDAKLHLENAFATGEKININWQQIQPKSPRIDLNIEKPYVFNSQFGLMLDFNLYKRDSAFLNLNFKIGLSYSSNLRSKTEVFFSNSSTRIIEPDTLYVKQFQKLPNILDVSFSKIGIGYTYSTIKNRKNRSEGFELAIETSGGLKNFRKNDVFTTIKSNSYDYKKIYDSIKLNDYQVKILSKIALYKRLTNLSTLKVGLNLGLIYTTTILTNEQFQIGGYKILRGFDEENIFANQYLVGSLEYRYLFAESSYFFGFIDGGTTKNSILQKNYNYVGMGVGMALETKQGILQVSLALGKRNDLPLNFRESKIHIGLINNF